MQTNLPPRLKKRFNAPVKPFDNKKATINGGIIIQTKKLSRINAGSAAIPPQAHAPFTTRPTHVIYHYCGAANLLHAQKDVGCAHKDVMCSHKDVACVHKDVAGAHKDVMRAHKDVVCAHKDVAGTHKDVAGAHTEVAHGIKHNRRQIKKRLIYF
ncbi:MAG: hypothetical protein M3040_12900 [Bacteroidota bacterium]|nr:hypothetical protein [Bacteroidota bacterium]